MGSKRRSLLAQLARPGGNTMIATHTRARGPPLRRRRPRPLSPISFCVWRIPDPAGAGDGPRAAGASGRDLWGLGAIAGLLRTAVGVSQACSLSVDVVQRQRHAAIFFFTNGDRRRRRWSSRMDLAPPGRATAAATYGVGARAPLTIRFLVAFGEFRPVDHDRCPFARATRAPRRRPLSPIPFCAWGSGWSRRLDLGLLGRAAATYGVSARSPGCCAQRLGVSGVLSIR